MIFINESVNNVEVFTYNDYDTWYAVPANTFTVVNGNLHEYTHNGAFKLRLVRLDGATRTEILAPGTVFSNGERTTINADFTVDVSRLFPIPRTPPNPPGAGGNTMADGEGFTVAATPQKLVSSDGASTFSLEPDGRLLLMEAGNPNPAWEVRRQVHYLRLFRGELLAQDAFFNVLETYSGHGGDSSMTLQNGCVLVVVKPRGLILATRLRGGSGTGFYTWDGRVQ